MMAVAMRAQKIIARTTARHFIKKAIAPMPERLPTPQGLVQMIKTVRCSADMSHIKGLRADAMP
jgi:hypothetical protein